MPADAKIVVITPTLTTQWNQNIQSGTGTYYTYYGFTENDMINFAQWMNSVDAHIKQLNEIIHYYEEEAKKRNEALKAEPTKN